MTFSSIDITIGAWAMVWAFMFSLSCYNTLFGSKSRMSLVMLFVSLTLALGGLEVWIVLQPWFLLAGNLLLPDIVVVLMISFAAASILTALREMLVFEGPRSVVVRIDPLVRRRQTILLASIVVGGVGAVAWVYGIWLQIARWRFALNEFIIIGDVVAYGAIAIHWSLKRKFAPVQDWEL